MTGPDDRDAQEQVDAAQEELEKLNDLLAKHRWYKPILLALLQAEPSPASYTAIRDHLMEHVGRYPGDGGLSRELRAMLERTLVAKVTVAGSSSPGWSLTDRGRQALEIRERLRRLSQRRSAGQPAATPEEPNDRDPVRRPLQTIWGRKPVPPP